MPRCCPILPIQPRKTANPLWQGEAGEAANTFFVGLLDDGMPSPEIQAADYADLYRSLLARENVRERTPVHPRVSIWGPFEARLQQPDVLILGSLNEGTWPETADPGAWLNRPMRQQLKLALAGRRYRPRGARLHLADGRRARLPDAR